MPRKIPFRYCNIVFALIMSLSTALIVSAVIISMHGATQANFLRSWMHAFLTAWPIVFASILTIAPQVNRLLNRLVEQNHQPTS